MSFVIAYMYTPSISYKLVIFMSLTSYRVLSFLLKMNTLLVSNKNRYSLLTGSVIV